MYPQCTTTQIKVSKIYGTRKGTTSSFSMALYLNKTLHFAPYKETHLPCPKKLVVSFLTQNVTTVLGSGNTLLYQLCGTAVYGTQSKLFRGVCVVFERNSEKSYSDFTDGIWVLFHLFLAH